MKYTEAWIFMPNTRGTILERDLIREDIAEVWNPITSPYYLWEDVFDPQRYPNLHKEIRGNHPPMNLEILIDLR